MSSPQGVPQRKSLSFIGLFQKGPWPAVVLVWLVALGATILWIGTPWMRQSLTGDWRVATCFGSAFGLLLARLITAQYFGRPNDFRVWLLVVVCAGGLGGVAALLLPGRLGFEVSRATACAPLVILGEARMGRFVSYLLPCLLWLLWCRHTLATFPSIDARIWKESSSRWDSYSRALTGLGSRISAAFAFALFVVFLAGSIPLPVSADNADAAIALLQGRGALALSELERNDLFRKVEAERQRVEMLAFTALANLDFENAHAHAAAASCTLLLPGAAPDPELVRVLAAFGALDKELAKHAGKNVNLSAATVQSSLALLPLHANTEVSLPPCPLFWPSGVPTVSVPEIDSLNELTTARKIVSYKGVELLDVRLATLQLSPTQAVTLEVAIRINGSVGDGTAFPALVQKRLGAAPTNGPVSIGAGAMCATWRLASLGLRLGPAVGPKISSSELNPRSPLWLTCYDPSLSKLLWKVYRRTDEYPSWDPHGCGYLPDKK